MRIQDCSGIWSPVVSEHPLQLPEAYTVLCTKRATHLGRHTFPSHQVMKVDSGVPIPAPCSCLHHLAVGGILYTSKLYMILCHSLQKSCCGSQLPSKQDWVKQPSGGWSLPSEVPGSPAQSTHNVEVLGTLWSRYSFVVSIMVSCSLNIFFCIMQFY